MRLSAERRLGRRAVLLLALGAGAASVGACALSPGVLTASANLRVDVYGIDAGASELRVSVEDADGATLVREPPVSGPTLSIWITGVAEGVAHVHLGSFDPSQTNLQCAEVATRVAGPQTETTFDFASATGHESGDQCYDEVDNDCDGSTDCADADCAGATRPCLTDKACTGSQTCNGGAWGPCSHNTSVPENNPALCSDQVDNDCDNHIDCDDSACQSCQACGC